VPVAGICVSLRIRRITPTSSIAGRVKKSAVGSRLGAIAFVTMTDILSSDVLIGDPPRALESKTILS